MEHYELVRKASVSLANLSHKAGVPLQRFYYINAQCEKLFSNYSAATLQWFITGTKLTGEQFHDLFTLIDNKRWNETEVNDYLVQFTHGEGQRVFNPTMTVMMMITNAYIKGLRKYPGLCPVTDYSAYPDERRDQISALLHATYLERMAGGVELNINEEKEEVFVLSNKTLANLLITPGKYEREDIVRVMEDHRTFDTGRIKELLDFEVPVMRDGVL